MKQLIGEAISVLPFIEIKKISDLIYFDGPILSHFMSKYGKDVLFYWVDFNENFNRWIVFQVPEDSLSKYLKKEISLKKVFESPINDIFYSVEIGYNIEYKNILKIYKNDLPVKYFPEDASFYYSETPIN